MTSSNKIQIKHFLALVKCFKMKSLSVWMHAIEALLYNNVIINYGVGVTFCGYVKQQYLRKCVI